MDATQSVSGRDKKIIMAGQRHNLDINRHLEFGPHWSRDVRLEVKSSGTLGSSAVEDYIVFPKGHFLDIHPEVIEPSYCDGWFLSEAREKGFDFVDSTPVIMAIHQNHDYGHIAKDVQGIVVDQQTKRNEELSGGPDNILIMKDRTHVLNKNGRHVAMDIWRVWRFIQTAPILYSGMPTFLKNGFYLVNNAINLLRQITIRLGMRRGCEGPDMDNLVINIE